MMQMSESMNMIFETADLAVASPATVSRCGMVYMEPESLGWRPLLESWLPTLPEDHWGPAEKHVVEQLFDWMLPPVMRVVRKECQTYIPISDINMAVSLMRIFEVR